MKANVQVERGIAPPANRLGRRGMGMSQAIRDLQPGESFKIPAGWNVNSVRACAYALEGRAYQVAKDDAGVMRIWRNS